MAGRPALLKAASGRVSGETPDVDGQHVSVHGHFVGWDYVGTAAGYGLLYILALLVLAMVIFSRRNFV